MISALMILGLIFLNPASIVLELMLLESLGILQRLENLGGKR